MEKNNDLDSKKHLNKAINIYKKWGASIKVEQLTQHVKKNMTKTVVM